MKHSFRFVFLALLLCAAFVFGAAADTLSEAVPADPVEEKQYEEKTVYVGIASIDAGVNIRKSPNADSAKVAKMPHGAKCTVLGEQDGWYAVLYKGTNGYVRKDLLTVKKSTVKVEKIVEDPLEAACKGFDITYMAAPGADLTVKGTVGANIPITEVRLTVVDLRQLSNEAVISVKFSREQNVLKYDLSGFTKNAAFRKLTSGEKKAVVTVCSANESKKVAELFFYITGKCTDSVSMTDACTIAVSRGSKSAMLDNSYGTSWSPSSSKDVIKIRIPDKKTAGGLLMEWDKAPSNIQIQFYDKNSNIIETVQEKNPSGLWNLYYELPEECKGIAIRSGDTDNGITKLRVYEKDRVPQTVQQWEQTPEKIDLMMVCPHMNDETLYFSGTLSQLSAQGYNVMVVYMTGDDRNKHAEALDCLWSAGVKIHPTFVGFKDYKVDSYAKAEWLWGKENTLDALITLIRKYKPEVVLTMDWNGEYGHNQHIMTSRYTVKAVEGAALSTAFTDSAEQYGTWQVPKLYLHMADASKRLDLRFNAPMEELGGRSPMQMAFITFDKHQSQIKRYSLKGDGVTYDCTWFSLYKSTVGEDVAKNSFFEHLDIDKGPAVQ